MKESLILPGLAFDDLLDNEALTGRTLLPAKQQEGIQIKTAIKGTQSAGVHMCNRYHFIANLHITEMGSIPFLTKYDKMI